MIVDGKDMLLGRLSSLVASKALLGEKVDIVNCEKIVISGKKERIYADQVARKQMGSSTKGPFFFRVPEKFVRKAIRGMLPYKGYHGRLAYERIKCHRGIPAAFAQQKPTVFEEAHVKRLKLMRFASVEEICNIMGGK
ncbi:MAG: 50S ribosomal protein L13 [Nanoarchaeota archaeon]|nr:50S ribosomal protein L13 [Nanoarchaeota archaeon]